MTNVIERRRFSELGDQQLLEQTRRLAANQRCIDVHILDHLDEIDQRGLALRRGFSSLFDYAVRELRFSDAAAQRRIQAMRLCRRHGWVRASLQSGELSMTSAGQLETTFAGAERAERQSHTGHGDTYRRACGRAGSARRRILGADADRTPAAVAPVAPAPRRGGATPAPLGNTAATERQNPIGVLANAAPPSQSAPAAPFDGARAGGVPSDASAATAAPQAAPAVLSDGARAGGAPSGAPAATAAPKFASGALADGSRAGTAMPGLPVATSAPERALGVSPDGGPSGASDGATGVVSAAGFSSRAGVPGSPVATAAAKSVLGVLPDGGPPYASAGAAEHTTREPVHSRHHSPPRRHIPAAVRRHVWLRDGGRCCYRDPLSGRRCTSSHLLQIDHLLPVAEGGGPEPSNLELSCAAHHRMRHGYGPVAPPEPPM